VNEYMRRRLIINDKYEILYRWRCLNTMSRSNCYRLYFDMKYYNNGSVGDPLTKRVFIPIVILCPYPYWVFYYINTYVLWFFFLFYIVSSNNLWIARLRHQRHLLDKTPHAEPYISDDYSMNPVSVQNYSFYV